VRDDEYVSVIVQLASEHFDRANLKKLYSDRDGSLYGQLKVIIAEFAAKLTARIPYIDHPYVDLVTSTARQVYSSISRQIGQLVNTVLRWRSQEDPVRLTLAEVEEIFTRVFDGLIASTLTDTGTKLTFATIAIPDFFNKTLATTVLEASRKAGIETVARAIPRTLLAHFENPTIPEGDSVLVLDQGIHHCLVRAFSEGGGRAGSGSSRRKRSWAQIAEQTKRKNATQKRATLRDGGLPLDPWRSQVLHQRLLAAVKRANPELETQLEIGADENILMAMVVQARMLLKKQDLRVVYIGTESRSADFYTTIEHNDDHPEQDRYLDEVPLHLDDWWVDRKNPGVKLTREMVLRTDEDYVKSLGNTIAMFVRAMQDGSFSPQPMFKGHQFTEFPINADSDDPATEPLTFGQVVILTEWIDRDLVRRAVKKAMGNDVPIIGGSLRNITMVADGAARMALIRRQNLLRLRGEESGFAHDEL
jgi:hypothetical protein